MDEPTINLGLEGIYFTKSEVCKLDGINGRLYYRGYPIETLSKNSNFEEVCYLLLYGKLPNEEEFNIFASALKSESELPEQVISIIKDMSNKAHPMDTLRTAVSALSAYDNDVPDSSIDANMRKSVRLIAKTCSIVATIGRFRNGESYIRSKPNLSFAGNFLYMLNGSRQSQQNEKILDIMLMLHAEHSSNASTFSTLVAGATLSDIHAAVTSGIATLKGPLHGGADEAALAMMRAIGRPDNTEEYIESALEGKKRIMGFGHRVYKTYDPRARIIKVYLESMQDSSSEEVRNLTSIALRAEKLMVDKLGKTKGIWPNVDFFSGPVYTALGIPGYLFTPLFAVSRMPGWCAHMIEYWKSNRLIRPLEYYSGPIDLEYIPMENRS
ncbi:MAG: citrate synthase/methylcitrate synthase [Candidatus Micrarchaeota archaeon]|nr:citrate synthase/methylcitrate synthase [Candidatus Micrarchaeota archaeon]